MIRVQIISGTLVEAAAIADHGNVPHYFNIGEKEPSQVFDALIELNMDWEIDYDEATEDEEMEWGVSDIIGRTVRAKKMGKTILLGSEPVGYEEFEDRLVDFIEANDNVLPTVISDNSQSLILGILEEDA